MTFKLLYRYISAGILKIFLGLIVLFSVIIVSSQFMHLPSVVYFMDFFKFLKLIFFIDFSFFKYQLLFAFILAATLFGYSLKEKREIYAIYASGISTKTLLKPVFFISIFLSIIALIISLFITPYANRERANFITVSVKEYFMESIQPKNFSKVGKDIVIYAKSKKDNLIENLFIHMHKKDWTITAEKAKFIGSNLILENGFIQIPQKNNFDVLFFKKYIFSIDINYIKKYSLEDYENKKLIEIIRKKGKKSLKAQAILTDRVSFFIPFLFIGVIGFLIGISNISSKEHVLSFSLLISIVYLFINFLSVKLISGGSLPFYSLPVVEFLYFLAIYFLIKKKLVSF